MYVHDENRDRWGLKGHSGRIYWDLGGNRGMPVLNIDVNLPLVIQVWLIWYSLLITSGAETVNNSMVFQERVVITIINSGGQWHPCSYCGALLDQNSSYPLLGY